MFRNTAKDYIKNEIDPDLEKLEAQEPGLLVKKLAVAGELGLLGLGIPEQYGGSGLDFTTNAFVGEVLGLNWQPVSKKPVTVKPSPVQGLMP